jgi:hypothetical protein
MSDIAYEIVNIVIDDSNIAAFSPLCWFRFTGVLLRIKMNAFFATPFKRLRRKKGVI